MLVFGTCIVMLKLNTIIIVSFFLVFEEQDDPTTRSFFSEIISSISDVKISNSGRYMMSRDYMTVKVWDLHMETKPIETYPVCIAYKFSNYILFSFDLSTFYLINYIFLGT